MTRSITKLTPEEKRALRWFEQAYTQQLECSTTVPPLEVLTVSGNHFFFNREVQRKHLPHGPRWIWGQSRGKREIPHKAGSLIFCKLNPRPQKGNQSTHTCKMWIFTITAIDLPLTTMLWCEETLLPKIHPITLGELSFLSPFVSREVAIEFGWISSDPNNV